MRTGWILAMAACCVHPARAAQSWVDASGWREHAGDDLRWALPEFDDSGWRFVPRISAGGVQPGFGWYRTCFVTPAWWAGRELAIALPQTGFAFELFVDGKLAGTSGTLPQKPGGRGSVLIDGHRPFPVPENDGRKPICAALRRWASTGSPDAGASALMPIRFGTDRVRLGLADALAAEESLQLYRVTIFSLTNNFLRLLILASGLLLLLLYRRQPDHREYLWIGLADFCFGAAHLIGIPARFAHLVPWNSAAAIAWNLVFYNIGSVLPLYFYLSGVVYSRLRPAVRILAAAIAILDIVFAASRAGFLPPTWIASNWHYAPLVALGAVAVVRNQRQGNWGDMALCLGIVARASIGMSLQGTNLVYLVGPFYIHLITLAQAALAGAMAGILVVRFRREERRLRMAEQELAAATRVQRLLLESTRLPDSAFSVEQAYLPARNVGGDFYQWLEADNGSRILLAGDVSGKGLDAAMLVAVIIGALRREPSRDPGAILANLNRVLLSGKRQGFVTCCCLRIEPDGAMTVCNAGHVAPYVDGRELKLPDALPLGIVETSYEETRVSLTPGCQVTIVSDGVVEAATGKGELFGFERTAAISSKSANAIAEAARAWGQNDDITVVTVRRTR